MSDTTNTQEWGWIPLCICRPRDAYAKDPEGYWQFFHEHFPEVPRKEIESKLKEVEQ